MRQRTDAWATLFIAAGLLAMSHLALAQTRPVQVKTSPAEQVGTSDLALGVTLTQTSFRDGTNSPAAAEALKELKAVSGYINQFIMGWGAHNPEPSPGQFDWESLDARVALMQQSGGVPVLTLCCAPDWMKGGKPGETDLKRIDEAPDPDHYDDYVELVRKVALRYPAIRHYQVWAEYKGFWKGPKPARWDYENYTILYNKIYDTLKSISPEIKVGGPYALMEHWLQKGEFMHSSMRGPYGFIDKRPLEAVEFWLEHKHGADWISVDGAMMTKEGLPGDLFAAGALFTDVSAWIKSKSSLPLWWSEFYPTPFADPTEGDDAMQNALMSSALLRLAPFASVALRWGPEGDVRRTPEARESLWSDTTKPDGGKPYPFYFTMVDFRRHFPPGTKLVRVTSSSPDLAVLASPSCVMVVNQTERQIDAEIDGEHVTLARYETKFVTHR
jgi:hypothetical protein